MVRVCLTPVASPVARFAFAVARARLLAEQHAAARWLDARADVSTMAAMPVGLRVVRHEV